MGNIEIKRIYDDVHSGVNDAGSAYRILVDRIWPRGISKERAALDEWNKDLAPSNDLRKWFNHDDDKFAEFEKRYRRELEPETNELARLKEISNNRGLLLLYGAKNERHNQAVVLQKVLTELG